MKMRAFAFSMAAVFFAAMTVPALAAPGGHGGRPASAGPPASAGDKSNSGGELRGLDRADQVAGEHGRKGRDNARTRGNRADQDVKAAQKALKGNGRDPGEVDGKMGPRTRATLADFQKSEGLKVTGQLDKDTRSRLGL